MLVFQISSLYAIDTKKFKVERVYDNLPKVTQLTVLKARICPYSILKASKSNAKL
jgi:hypothetical protein